MPQTGGLSKVSIAQEAARLNEPFTMIDLARIDDLALSVFLCQGAVPYHRHLDQDELFLVYRGTISLETEWGTAILRPGDLAVAPKGVGHRSSSLVQSHVLLLQPRLMANRRNGHRRFFALEEDGNLEKVNVWAMGRQIKVPFQGTLISTIDVYDLTLTMCEGTGSWSQRQQRNDLILCAEGTLVVETTEGRLTLAPWELVVVPKDTSYRLYSNSRSLVLSVERRPAPGLVQ